MTARRFAPTRPLEVVVLPATGEPCRLHWRGRAERVTRVEGTWAVAEGWWRGGAEATRRRYFRLVTHSGLLCVIYRDLSCGRWYLEQIID
jgi:hypothetical protein